MPVNILRPNVGALEPLIHRVGVLNVNLGGTLQELRRDINAGLLRFLGAKRFIFVTAKLKDIDPNRETRIITKSVYKTSVKIRVLHGIGEWTETSLKKFR